MNEAKLILDIGADVSQFNASLADVRAKIKSVLKEIESASGAKLGELNFQLTGLERTEETLQRFGSFAEGTLGALKNRLATLKQESLEIPIKDEAKFILYNKLISDTTDEIKRLQNLGKEKTAEVVSPAAINSIEYFKAQIDSLRSARAKISIDTSEGVTELGNINRKILEFQKNIKNIEGIGIDVDIVNENTLEGLNQKLRQLESAKIKVDVQNEEELAKLNDEIRLTQDRIRRLNDLSIDPKGGITTGAAKARQSITNLGLVLQDLPFGFIAIQNNIPNLISSFQGLQVEAKNTKTSVATLIGQQFAGASGAVLGLGLGISALTGIVTALVQEYGSLSAAIDAVIARSITLEDINKKVQKSFFDVTKSTAGEAANLKSLISIYTDATTSQTALLGVKEKINKDYPTLIAFLQDENRLTEESRKIIEERSKAILKQSVLEGRRQGLVKLISEETAKGEKSVASLNKVINNELDIVEGLTLAFRSLFVPLKAGPQGVFELLSKEIDNASKSITVYKQKLEANNKILVEVEGEINAIIKAIQEESKKQTEASSKRKRDAEERLRELEQYRQALLKFNTLKIDVFEFPDDKKVIDEKIKTLSKYGDVLLDTTKYDFERADALRNVIAVDKEYFKNLDLEKMSLVQIKAAVDSYIESLVKLQNVAVGKSAGQFEQLFKTIQLFTKDTRIPSLLKLAFPEKDFEAIKESAKGLKKDVVPEFDKLNQDITNALVLQQAIKGTALSLDEIKAVVTQKTGEINEAISKQKLTEFLSGPAAEEQNKRAKALFDSIVKKAEDFQKNVQGALEKPFRDFFDTILEEGKISFDSFAELFKDLVKRIASQLIASGIAKILTKIVFPESVVTDGGGMFAKFIKTFFSAGGLLGGGIKKESNNINFGGVTGQNMQLAGEVVFVQRGSDLIGAINRTNATINRVG
jgi:hypothetical protein